MEESAVRHTFDLHHRRWSASSPDAGDSSVLALKESYLEHVFWQWYDQINPSEQELFYTVGTILSGAAIVLTRQPERAVRADERMGYPFQDETGLRHLALISSDPPPQPFLDREELDYCLRIASGCIDEFLHKTLTRSITEEKNTGILKVLTHLHFATFGAMVRRKSIKAEFMRSCLDVLEKHSNTSPTRLNLVLAMDQIKALLVMPQHPPDPASLQSRLETLHVTLTRFPGLLEHLVQHTMLSARHLSDAIHEFRSKLREVLKDVSFVPDNPKVELFLRRTAVLGFSSDLKRGKEPFTQKHEKIVRPYYRSIKNVLSRLDDSKPNRRIHDFISSICRLMEVLRLIRAPQERKDVADHFSTPPFFKLCLAYAVTEIRRIVDVFSFCAESDDLVLDFDAGFSVSPEQKTASSTDLFDGNTHDFGLDADEVAAAVDSPRIERGALDANRIYDLLAIFTWRLGKTTDELDARLAGSAAAADLESSLPGSTVHRKPTGGSPASLAAHDQAIQDFRESSLSQCRQVIWEICREIDDTITYDEIMPEFRTGKEQSLALRMQLLALFERTCRYHELIGDIQPLDSMDLEDLHRRNQLLKQSFLVEVKHFQKTKIAFRPDDREIFYDKLHRIAVSEKGHEIYRQIDDLKHFLSNLLCAVNRRWVLTIVDKEKLEECRTRIESFLMGSREVVPTELEELACLLDGLRSRGDAISEAIKVIRGEIAPLLQSPSDPSGPTPEDRAFLPKLINIKLEKIHASITHTLLSEL